MMSTPTDSTAGPCNSVRGTISRFAILAILFLYAKELECSPILNLAKCDNFTSSEEIHIMIVNEDDQKDLVPLTPSSFHCPDQFQLYLLSSSDNFVIDLTKNKRLISDRYFDIKQREREQSSEDQNNHFLPLHDITSNEDHCHYHGTSGQISAISIIDRSTLRGFFEYSSHVYYLEPISSKHKTYLTKSNANCLPNTREDQLVMNSIALNRSDLNLKRRKRAAEKKLSGSQNLMRQLPYQSNSSSLYVELLIVHDHSQFKEYGGNRTEIAERSLQIVNIMNAFYRQLNVFIALVGVVVWEDKDEIELSDDGDATLTNFLKYRHDKLLSEYHHDNAQLITNMSFTGKVVGKALKGPICTHEHSGGVNTDHSSSPAIVAVTLAHELGHNFGMEHDEEDKCKCPDEKCIMSSSSSAIHPKHWSSCSIAHFEDARKSGWLDCLIDQPENVVGPVCGNGFVEDGEDCDLGVPIPTYGSSKSRKGDSRSVVAPINNCCNRKTCKFIGNATCAQGACCNIANCSIYQHSDRTVCRERQGECDLEEICDGQSEQCPTDVYFHDGIECNLDRPDDHSQDLTIRAHGGQAHCHKGHCTSRDQQCRRLWGPTGYSSNDICYDQNVHGNTTGNCGYNRKEKQYEGCSHENSLCGMLHCVHDQDPTDERKSGKLNYGFESSATVTVTYFVNSDSSKTYCYAAIIDHGPNMPDPGLVPNGVSCGRDRMCVNQKCLPVSEVVNENWCPSDCNGYGICDNTGVCHCHDGTIGGSCYQFFGLNFQLSLLLYIVVFFIPMIILIVIAVHHYKQQIKIWWFLNRRKEFLSKSRTKGAQKRVPQDLKDGKVVISNPIPLAQHNNINKPPVHEQDLDPWAETSCQSGATQYQGYTLTPLEKPPEHSHLKPVRAAPPPPVPPGGRSN